MKKMIKFKLIAALIAVMMLLIFANANGQGIKISALPTLTSPDSSADYIPIVHSGTTYKVTPGKLFFEFGASGGGGSVAGSNTQIQYNNSGAFGASADFTWNNGTSTLTTVNFISKSILINPNGTSAGNTGEIRLSELVANGSNYTGFKSTDSRSTNLIYTLPSTDPTSGNVLVAGSPSGGVVGLAWAGIGAAGSNNQIQFNDGGDLAGSSDLLWIDADKEFYCNSSIFDIGSASAKLIIDDNNNISSIFQNQGGVTTGFYAELDSATITHDQGLVLGKAEIVLEPYSIKLRGAPEQPITLKFLEGTDDGSNYIGLMAPSVIASNFTMTLPGEDGTAGQVLFTDGSGILGWADASGTGTVTSIATTSPITGGTITTTGTIGISDALADGSTKGAASFSISDFNATSGNITIDYNNGTKAAADGSTLGFATFTAADFNSSAGLMSIDYTNAQSASTSTKGFLTDTDWDTFNDKLAATGTMTGATSQRQDFTNGIGVPFIDDDGAGSIELAFSTVTKATFSAGGLQIIPDGSALSPSLSVGSNTHGLYQKSATELGASVAGALVGGFNTTGLFTDVIAEQTAAAGVTVDGVLLKDGLVLGQYGGTGVNNSGKTITLGGNLTTSGAHATTFTTTGTTGVTLPTTGTIATLAGTETFTNKSIVGTQLTGTSYTFAANNTGSTAAYTLQPYEDHDLATYSGTVDFNGTDPSSITSQQYAWSRIGNTVTLFFSIFYGTPGVTNTSAIITLPSDCPTPAVFAAAGDAASEYMYPINGGRVEANMTGNPSAIRGGLRKNSSNNGYEVALIFGSVSAAQCQFTISYRTQ